MVYARCVFVADLDPSSTCMSGSFESVGWNTRVHRLDLGLYSHPKEFLETEMRTHVNLKGKIPSTGGPEEDQASGRTASPRHYRLS